MKWFKTKSDQTRLRRARRRLLVALPVLIPILKLLWMHSSLACGPFFPNTLLLDGDLALLKAPDCSFVAHISQIAVPAPGFTAVPATNGVLNQTLEMERSDLQAALARSQLDASNAEALLADFERVRSTLQRHAAAVEEWREQQLFRSSGEPPARRPPLAGLPIPAGLPHEFAAYLQGSIHFHAGETNAARRAWKEVLALHASERRARSTWASFMLGKTYLVTEPRRAIEYFQQVRALVEAGCQDSLGLAAASLGWEAKAELHRANLVAALRLYLLQFQTGDETAIASLRLTLRKIVGGAPVDLQALAADPLSQQVVTAFLVSGPNRDDEIVDDERYSFLHRWLEGVRRAGTHPVPGAANLALAAYQVGWFELAEGWLKHAPASSAMAQWLQAKLLLRAGKMQEAARILSGVSHLFGREAEWGLPVVRQSDEWGEEWEIASPVRRSMGEMGVLHLTRREYYQALEILLRAGYWVDAAYVAESVLTPDELMAYTDRHWPPLDALDAAAEEPLANYYEGGNVQPAATRVALRHLVARRLARLQRWDEALDFCPPEWQPAFQSLVHALRQGRDQTFSVETRAQSLWKAAHLTRHQGMELLGTELEPDWFLHAGNFERTPIPVVRSEALRAAWTPRSVFSQGAEQVPLDIAQSSADERRRINEHQLRPQRRFHYRYLAAELAWEAAQLMPDDSEETAFVLWQAGSWLKIQDPLFADRFYKALVRRCGGTPLGAAADRLRWFPKSPTPAPRAEPVLLTEEPIGESPADAEMNEVEELDLGKTDDLGTTPER